MAQAAHEIALIAQSILRRPIILNAHVDMSF